MAIAGSRVYLGGDFTRIARAKRASLAAFGLNGRLLPWSTSARIDDVSVLAADERRVYVASGNQASYLAIDAETGKPAGPALPQPDGGILTFVSALEPEGDRLLLGGTFASFDAVKRRNLAAIDRATGTIESWNPGANGEVYAIAERDGTVFAGGEFTRVAEVPRALVAALDATSGAVAQWDPAAIAGGAAYAYVDALALAGETLYVGGAFTRMGGADRENLAAIDVETGFARAWRTDVRGRGEDTTVEVLALRGSTLYVGGLFDSVSGEKREHSAALDTTSGALLPWNPRPDGWVRAISPTSDVVYLGGEFAAVGGGARDGVAAVDPVSGATSSWAPAIGFPGPQPIFGIVSGNGRVYVGGDFQSPRDGHDQLVELDAITGATTDWSPFAHFYGRVYRLAASGATLYAGGESLYPGGNGIGLVAYEPVGLAVPAPTRRPASQHTPRFPELFRFMKSDID